MHVGVEAVREFSWPCSICGDGDTELLAQNPSPEGARTQIMGF